MPGGVVARQRLFDALVDGPRVRLVCAPSGSGKTTLLRSWVDSLPAGSRTVVWVALTAAVATVGEFWRLVGSAAVHGDGTDLGVDPAGGRACFAGVHDGEDPVLAVARMLDQAGRARLLVLDGYEQLRGLTERIDDDLLRLIDATAGLEVAVATRAPTRLTEAVLTTHGVVRVIDERQLRFTVDEAEQLLALHAPHARDAAARVVVETHGYPLGVRAAAHLSGRPASMPTLDDHAWQRLVAADLRSQLADPELGEFVLDTSVPPYFDADLARRLTSTDDVDAKLAELAWHGYGRWTAGAGERPVFQYVEPARDALRAQLRSSDPARHRRSAALAAAWLHRRGDDDLALTLALDAENYELAAAICRRLLVVNPDASATESLERHLRRVPAGVLADHPTLAFIKATTCAANPTTRASAPEYFEIAARHALDGIGAVSAPEAVCRHVGRAVSLRRVGRASEATSAAQRALGLLAAMTAGERDQLGEFWAVAVSLLAFSFLDVGEVTAAAAVADRAAATARSHGSHDFSCAAAAVIRVFDGSAPATPCHSIANAPAASARTGPRSPHVLGVAASALAELDRLDFAAAHRTLGDVDGRPDVVGVWPLLSWVRLHAELGTGRAATGAHRISVALAWRSAPTGAGPNLGTAALLNTLAIAWFASGDATRARRILAMDVPNSGQLAPARLLDQLVNGEAAAATQMVAELLSEPGHTNRSVAAVETLGAAAARRAGDMPRARALLERAAQRYRAGGVRAHLLYVPRSDLGALRELGAESGDAAVAYLAGPLESPIEVASSRPVELSPRETAVLATWARHETRAAVATELFVSRNTVRSQLHSAYRKLGVTTKDAAIQRALALDLFAAPGVDADRLFVAP